MYIRVHVTAQARKETLIKEKDLYFSASVMEPAQRNMANKRLVQMIASYFTVSPRKVRLISGHHSSHKLFFVEEEG